MKAFKFLKNDFTIVPILIIAYSSKPFFLQVDATYIIHGAMLFNMGEMNYYIMLNSI
jgi:hypothetical protein